MHPGFDVRTLCVASAAAILSLAVVMTYVWRRRRTYPGFGQWTLSAWSAFLGTSLLAARGILIPAWLSILVVNPLLLLAAALLATGLVTFTGGRPRAAVWAGLLLGLTGLAAAFLYVWPSLQARLALFSFATTGICLRAAHLTWRRLPAILGDTHALTGSTLLVMAAFHLLRGIASLAIPPATQDFMAPSASQAGALLILLVGEACIYGGLIVVNAQRLERELQLSLEECQVLRGILPVCARCKKIRDDQGDWNPMEAYLTQRAAVEFTHGICPDCAQAFREEQAPA